jgi:hypothetical protein
VTDVAQPGEDHLLHFQLVQTTPLERKNRTSDNQVSDILVQAFAAEGVDTLTPPPT